MEQPKLEFVPKYRLRHRILLCCLPVWGPLFALAAIAGGREEPKLYLCLVLVAGGLFMWVHTFKRVRFGQSITLERYLLPDRRIEYASIVDVGFGTLRTKQGNVHFASMNCENVPEFDDAVEESRKRGYWSDSQIEGVLLGKQLAGQKAGLISLPIAVLGAIAGATLRPAGLQIHWLAWFCAIQLILGLALYVYFRRRAA